MARFYLDHDVDVLIAPALRRRGHDASTTLDHDRDTAADDEQLLFAAKLRAILVTHNFNDFQLLHGAWRRWTADWGIEIPHTGILVILQRRWSAPEAAEQIDTFITSLDGDLTNRMFRWRPSTNWYEID